MRFIEINRKILAEMQDVLSRSAGYQVSLTDELEYYEAISRSGTNITNSWILALQRDQHLGFIRYFCQSEDWSLGEFFVEKFVENRTDLATNLLREFQDRSSFTKGHRLRFDILKSDFELNQVIEKAGFSQKRQLFLHFERETKNISELFLIKQTANKADSLFAKNNINISGTPIIENIVNSTDSKAVAEILSHLHPVSNSDAEAWIKTGSIRIVSAHGKIAAAAQIYESNDTLEINRIATHSDFLRQGFAQKLIESILIEAKNKNKKCVYLKVEDLRLPAIELYKKTEFNENESKAQYWHSRWF